MQNNYSPPSSIRLTSIVILTIFALQTCFANESRAQNETAAQTLDSYGYLRLNTAYTGISVRIDGKLVGTTPLKIQQLSAGTHRVQVAHPNRTNWLDRDWIETVEVAPNDTLEINVTFKQSYSINSRPYGAQVFTHGENVGETPVFLRLNEGETVDVRLVRRGYEDSTFVVGKNGVQFFDIELKPSLPSDVDLQMESTGLQKRSKTKLRLFTTLGLALASGSLALYFRHQADSNYDRYLKNGNPERFDQFYDNSKKYDRLAAITFASFQVNFVFSFYFFLKQVNP